jgi:hypothetical protein
VCGRAQSSPVDRYRRADSDPPRCIFSVSELKVIQLERIAIAALCWSSRIGIACLTTDVLRGAIGGIKRLFR